MGREASTTAVQHAAEINAGNRFKFGENWSRFLQVLDDKRIRQAETSFSQMLPFSIKGKTFLDAGSGSGLFSLAARRLGATVHSFDYESAIGGLHRGTEKALFPR
jgi:2-polyprenyl-3-methyl-5-hydroxy-6-metoxy-1,4-benzoquinol methylase